MSNPASILSAASPLVPLSPQRGEASRARGDAEASANPQIARAGSTTPHPVKGRERSESRARSRWVSLAFVPLAAACLLAALKLPLWHLRMEAPQYRDQEALKVNVFAGSMNGDLGEITVLNQYIGVHVPEVLPQSQWLPIALIISAALGVVASLLPFALRRRALLVTSIALASAIGVAVFQAKQQMHDIGHKRDAHTKLARVQDFDPPFLGTAKIAQFTVSSWLGSGAYLLGAAIVLQLSAAVVSRRTCGASCCCKKSRPLVSPKTLEALV